HRHTLFDRATPGARSKCQPKRAELRLARGLYLIQRSQLVGGAGEAAELDLDDLLLVPAHHADVDDGIRCVLGDLTAPILGISDVGAIDRGNDVFDLDASPLGGALGRDLLHQRTAGLAQTEALGEVLIEVLDLDAEPAARDRAGRLQLIDNLGDRGRWHRQRAAHTAPP